MLKRLTSSLFLTGCLWAISYLSEQQQPRSMNFVSRETMPLTYLNVVEHSDNLALLEGRILPE